MSPHSVTIPLQVRSRSEEITFLPQWSPPITLNISTLPPPTIVSSELIQTNVKPDDVSGGFTVNATVRVSLELPQRSEDFSEVWIGDRNLMEYEKPESGVSGVVFQFQVRGFCTNSLNVTDKNICNSIVEILLDYKCN